MENNGEQSFTIHYSLFTIAALIVFPNCKINLGLHVLGKRADGYHNIETFFYPLPFHDVLEVIQSSNTTKPYELFLSGNKIDGDVESNLCVKAYHLLKKDFPQLPSIKIYLYKVIPAGAGLGGGSANGAFMLMLLNDKFNLKLSQQQLLNYALILGSDCPFFIINKPCFAQQRGEILETVQLSLSGYKLLLVNPGIHINTGWAFTQVSFSESDIKNSIALPIEQWQHHLINDFEKPVFEHHPAIKNIKDQLYKTGALYASMSGSGSTVFGIFPGNVTTDLKSFPPDYFIKEMIL